MELPQRPRLRVSFWYEGAAAKCELVLMSERRELVHRETLDVGPGTGLERVHEGLLSAAATLAHAKGFAATGGVIARQEAPPAPPEGPPPEPSPEQLEQVAAERQRRAELAGERAEVAQFERELEPDADSAPEWPEPAAPKLSPEDLVAERERRARANTVIENQEPPPESETETKP
jgi:hypothetical protein